MPAERRFAWADGENSPFEEGATIAIVHDASPRAALHALAPRPATPVESPAKAEDWASGGSDQELRETIEARSLGHGWTMIVSVFGFHISQPSIVRRLSRLRAHT